MGETGPDPVRRAYATLGLVPGAPAAVIRRRYKELARRWHPDRFTADPAGRSEAATRMREINDAYARLRRTFLSGRARGAAGARASPRAAATARLSRDQIDRLVGAIGTESPLDGLIGTYDWYSDEILLTFDLLLFVPLILALPLRFLLDVDLLRALNPWALAAVAATGAALQYWRLRRRRGAERAAEGESPPALSATSGGGTKPPGERRPSGTTPGEGGAA